MGDETFQRTVVVTGGAGFVGSNLLLHLVPAYPDCRWVNVDCLTYAGNLANLKAIEKAPNYRFARIYITDFDRLADCFHAFDPSGIIHLAAESHVDRSILGPSTFIRTNILGTFNLLELARKKTQRSGPQAIRFHQVSTDEVFGSLGPEGHFTEDTPYRPNSPYSASKAAADHLVRSYAATYGLDTVTTHCSNNYGPYQFPEKLIPLMIRNARAGLPLPVYGDGKNVRDWLYVEDHCRALDLVFHEGKSGATYTIGGHNEIENLELVRLICRMLDDRLGGGPRENLITFVTDRLGHDRRYAIDASKIARELGWRPSVTFAEGLCRTIAWYLDHQEWLDHCISGQYLQYYEDIYAGR
ncbi:MAG: dTDP-glucose 4,6-dehydratase [candidate division Zixibacteria bacterium]|nr:dTDP-glucose 4,6-dehydratase [candidate division Zixibacteria bacterium]